MSGEKAAVALALEASENDIDEETEQLELLGIEPGAVVKALRERRSKTGRPPGARNKRTVAMANYLLSRYTSPLEVLAQIATARIDELSVAMGCTKLEAMQEKRLAALGLLPYLHQKQPVAVDVTERKVVNLTIVIDEDTGAGGHVDDDVVTISGELVKSIEGPKE